MISHLGQNLTVGLVRLDSGSRNNRGYIGTRSWHLWTPSYRSNDTQLPPHGNFSSDQMWDCREELFSQEQKNLPVPSTNVLHCGLINQKQNLTRSQVVSSLAPERFWEGNPNESLTSKKSEEIWLFLSFILGIHGICVGFLPHTSMCISRLWRRVSVQFASWTS